ncbi:MAG: hypothetical protein V3U97_05415 [bacterium]
MCKWGDTVEVEIIKEHVSLGNKVHVDRCMSKVVKELNRLGLKTTGCCCGHGKGRRYIGFQLKPRDFIKILSDGHILLEFMEEK